MLTLIEEGEEQLIIKIYSLMKN